jgi:23S rRNA (cytosine1962-C5)-methyltransferase
MLKVFLKPGKEEPVRRFHPWVFSGAIGRMEGEGRDGEIAEVYSRGGELLGVGHYHRGSIAVRLLSFVPADPERLDFWVAKFLRALALRQTIKVGEAYRLIHGEGDGLPGLIVDIYGSTAVVQCHSFGMHRQRQLIAEALRTVLEGRLEAVYDKSSETLPGKFMEGQENTYLWSAVPEPAASAVVEENGVRFRVNWETGQKTGFFLDQRDNRRLLTAYTPGKTVLNAFCYTGGFSAYALKSGARAVHSVDISGKAMELTTENVGLNQPFPGEHTGFTEDVLRFLHGGDTLYDVIVVDPPAYAKTLEKRHNAVQGYKRLNEAAIRRVAPGGILFTFSCSQVVDRELFNHTIVAAALEARRPVRVIHQLSQAPDHPVSIFHPEGSYLKGLVLHVDQ